MGTVTSLRDRVPLDVELRELDPEGVARTGIDRNVTTERPEPTTTSPSIALVRLLQFSSQSMPTGGFAYSSGLEMALEMGHFEDATTGAIYLAELLEHTLGNLDLPLLQRLLVAERDGDRAQAAKLGLYLLACRETSELRAQDQQMGRSLARVLGDLRPDLAFSPPPRTFAEAYARAAVGYGIATTDALLGYGYSWTEQHVTALARLLALGPIGTQRVLDTALAVLPRAVEHALALDDRAVGASAPGLAIASALHEEQYTRIFRS